MRLVVSSIFVFLFIVASGCGKGSTNGGGDFQSAFQKTPSHVKEFADEAVDAEKKNDFSTAFVHYRALSLNPDLTPEQRNLANDSMLEMGKKLREAAGKGDKQAEQVLENYHATK